LGDKIFLFGEVNLVGELHGMGGSRNERKTAEENRRE
jgi:hypothetical protein